jgi:hypothetical protein
VGVGRVGELPEAEIEGTMATGIMETPLTICAEAAPAKESPKINDFMIKTKVTRKRCGKVRMQIVEKNG